MLVQSEVKQTRKTGDLWNSADQIWRELEEPNMLPIVFFGFFFFCFWRQCLSFVLTVESSSTSSYFITNTHISSLTLSASGPSAVLLTMIRVKRTL